MNKDKNKVPSSSSKHKKTSKMLKEEQKRIEKLEQEGKDVYDSLHISNYPVMIPPAPNKSNYIDKYEEGPQLSKSNFDSQQRQQDYEAEVEVYRALERLNEEIIVIHGLEYTHGKYQLFVGEHPCKGNVDQTCKKNGRDTEEECDFVIIGWNYLVVIEVKNVSGDDLEGNVDKAKLLDIFKETFEDSLDQRGRTVKLIEGISKESTVLQFTAYPNLRERHRNDFKVTKSELSSIILKEDIENFGPWWRDNVIWSWREIVHFTITERVKQILLALWCTEKNKCDKLKCSLGRTIKEIDKKLRDADFTFKSKNRDPNPGVAPDAETPDIFKKYVGVNNLTTQQLEIFKSDQKLLYINGPAGSGKTVIMCGKIIELALSDDQSKILVFTFAGPGNNSVIYQSALKKAEVKCETIETGSNFSLSKKAHKRRRINEELVKMTATKQNNKVVIIKMRHEGISMSGFEKLREFVLSQNDSNIFIDDAQSMAITKLLREKSREFVKTLVDLSQDNYVWVAFDMAQQSTNPFTIKFSPTDRSVQYTQVEPSTLQYIHEELMCDEQRVTLNKNLRNTCDLASISSTIRDLYITSLSERRSGVDVVLPEQVCGHYIHGPRTTIHVFYEHNLDLVDKIVSNELRELLNLQSSDENDLQNYDIGIMYNTKEKNSYVIKVIKGAVNKECTKPDEIAICSYKDCPSAEWPAVIVLDEIFRVDKKAILNLTEIYSMIARARVKCSVLLFPPWSDVHDDKKPYGPNVFELLEKLEPIAQVIRH